jgi:hypothetical protein
MQNVKNIFQLDYSEYERLSSYLKLETKDEIFNILNQKLLLFSKYKNFTRLDVFIKKIKSLGRKRNQLFFGVAQQLEYLQLVYGGIFKG